MKKIFVLLIVSVVLVFAYGYFVERFHIKVEYVPIESEKFSSDYRGARIVQISDVHIANLGSYERKVAARVNALNPDLIVITGDFFQHTEPFEKPDSEGFKHNIQQVSAFVGLLQAKQGVYVCRGNNDFSNDKEVSDVFLDAMEKIGVTVLSNSVESIKLNEEEVYLLGIDYPEFHQLEAADFYIAEYKDGKCVQVNESERNSYSHFLISGDRTRWRDYVFSGKFRQSQPDAGGIGVTYYSQFDKGYDRFHRLRRVGGDETYQFSPHGVAPPAGDIYVATPMQADVWYNFRIECKNEPNGSGMRAHVWPHGSVEPEHWQANAVDSSTAFKEGAVGLWSHGKGTHQFDDLLVVTSSGDTLMYENFEEGEPLKDAFGWVDFNYEHESIAWMMQQTPNDKYSILLSHTPDKAPWAAEADVDLQLSGHTHGGQIRIPFLGSPVLRSGLGRKYSNGLFKFEEMQLYINRGIGTVLLPLRLFCRPEITVFDLQSGLK